MESWQLELGLEIAKTSPHSALDKEVIREHFNLDGKQVMDFGCGFGHMSMWMSRNFSCAVDGYDLDRNHIEVARELARRESLQNVNFEVRDIVSDPVDKTYDFIILNDVIEHIRTDYLRNILDTLVLRNLKPGGIIFISYPPWEGPYASHLLHRATRNPWIQFMPEDHIFSVIEKHNHQLVGTQDLREMYLELNHMTHGKLSALMKPLPVKQVYRKSRTPFNRISFLKNANLNFFPFRYVVSKELIAYRKD